MDKLKYKGKWNQLKGKLKEEYSELTNEDLEYSEGEEDQLVGHLQEKLGKSREEVRKMINDL